MHWLGWALAAHAAVGATVLAALLTHPDTLVLVLRRRVVTWTGLNGCSLWPGPAPPAQPSNGTELRRAQAAAWAATFPAWRWFYGMEPGVPVVLTRWREGRGAPAQ